MSIEPFDWARIVTVAPDQPVNFCSPVPDVVAEFAAGASKPFAYATIRLDDDDALSDGYLERLEQYVTPELAGSCVSFASGYAAKFDVSRRRLGPFWPQHYPKIALGLSMIHQFDPISRVSRPEAPCIHAAGDHGLIDRSFPLIVDDRSPSYIRTLHEHSDSFPANRAHPGGSASASMDCVRQQFTLDRELLAQ